jgi:GAF domain-containing protein
MANGEDTVDYTMLRKQLEALLSGESDVLANTANFVALLNDGIDRINWIGVYVLRGDELVLGPFQGKPACVRLPLGQGVCGTAAKKRQTLRIADVHAFDGHIACDSASNSELVVPLILGNNVIGVLDIDIPIHDRFRANVQIGLEAMCSYFVQLIEAPGVTFI